MITLPGQLSIKTITGRNGPFNVGRLATSIGEFAVKDPELDQYEEGKYDGDFIITEIRQHSFNAAGGIITQTRAYLNGMVLSGIDQLSNAEASSIGAQEVDPVDEESQAPTVAKAPASDAAKAPDDPLVDTKPFGAGKPSKSGRPLVNQPAAPQAVSVDDAALFSVLWPLGETVKLDSTVDRRVLRQQCDRLGKLGYEFVPLSQEWQLVTVAA